MNNLRKELAAVSGVTIASLVAAGCVPMVQEVQSPTQLPNLDLGTPSPTPEELGRIQDYCNTLGYDKVNYAATWKVAGEKPFAYSYCSVQENGVEQFVVVGYQNKDESVTMNQMLIADEATVDGRLYRVAGIFDPKDGAYKAIITVDEDGNQAAFDINDPTNMVIVPPQGDNGIGDQVKGFLGDFFIESAMAAELEETETPVAAVPTATEIPTETPTDIPTEVPTPTPVVEPGTVRTEFARGEVMTKEEIKVNVDWFYGLSDEDLNKIVEGNLFSSDEYPDDSRPRDVDGNILSEKEDLGWFYTKKRTLSGGLVFDSNYFNTIYLGTTYVKSGDLEYNVSALGSLDYLGNKMVIYAVNGIKDFGVDYFALSESTKDSVFSVTDVKPVSERTAIQNLLNNYLRKVVMTDVWYIDKPGSLSAMGPEGELLFSLTGGKTLIDGLAEQRMGTSKDVFSNFDQSLSYEYSFEDVKKFVFINSISIFRE